jgi:nitroreductase
MQDKPTNLPTTQPSGEPLKPFTQVVVERRATNRFTPEEVPEESLNAILRLGLQAPSGYNLQPWRFIVVRDEANRARLQAAAYNQAKVGQAPVVVIAVGMSAARAASPRWSSTNRARSAFSRTCRWTCGSTATR